MPKITKRIVDAITPTGENRIVWDDEVKGFGLRVSPGGTKSYIVSYRDGRGRNAPQHRITIGKHGSPWTPEMARKEALRLLGEVAAGDNPAETRLAEARAMTLSALCDLYLAEGTRHKKPSTIQADTGRITNHIKPVLGHLRIDQITRADVERMVRDVSDGKTAASETKHTGRGRIARGGSGTAAQAMAVLGAIMTFAVERGLRADNPVHGVKKPPSRKMERFLTEAETTRLGAALDEEIGRSGDPYPAAAIRLLLLTGCRRSEILGLRWEWIDFGRFMIFLPDSKTGRKPVYLNAPALAVLAGIPRQEGNPYVICGHHLGGAFVGLDKVWRRVCLAADLPGLRIHDLRHNYASVGAAGGSPLQVLGKLLGHHNVTTTERYAHLAADPMRRAAEAIGQRIEAALTGAPSAKVVPLPASRSSR